MFDGDIVTVIAFTKENHANQTVNVSIQHEKKKALNVVSHFRMSGGNLGMRWRRQRISTLRLQIISELADLLETRCYEALQCPWR